MDALGEALGVPAALIVVRENREFRARTGPISDGVAILVLDDADLTVTLTVPRGTVVGDDLLLPIGLALEARFLAESAETDALTGLANRRSFDERLAEEWARAARNGTSLAVALFDVDFFKAYNDRRGHLAGDEVLRRLARAAIATLQRAGDRFARFGGEEFVAIFPDTDLEGAVAAAERIRSAVSGLAIPHPVGNAGRLTISAGVAAIEPWRGGSSDDLVAAADAELYRAKAEGRDRVAAAGYVSALAQPGSVPRPLSALVGRDADVARVEAALGSHRVVTISGEAGVGKTRLALAAAHDAGARGEVHAIDVEGSASRDDIGARLAMVFGAAGEGDPFEVIASRAQGLVVLDGCERAAEAVCAAIDALAAAPLRFLITSRVPIGARDEFVVRLSPLDTGATRALFVDRAAAAGVVVDVDAPNVAAMLARLSGSPLAIELAARRLVASTPEAVSGAPAMDADGTSLGALLADAVAALSPAQASALIAVGAFRGPFNAQDAAEVIAPDSPEPRAADALLRSMGDRSLLDGASHDGVTHWRAIDPVREAAAALPGAPGLARAARAAHLRWARRRLDAIGGAGGTAQNRAGLLAGERIIDEVRGALDAALEDDALLADGAALCVAAVRHWFAIRNVPEGRALGAAFLARGDRLDPIVRAALSTAMARLAFFVGDIGAMEANVLAADALLGDEDRFERSAVLNFMGIVAKFRGDWDRAERCFAEGRALNARIGHRRGEAIAIGALGSMAFDIRLDFDEAVARFSEAAAIFRELGDDLNALIMTGNVAETLCARGDVADARPLLDSALEELRGFHEIMTLRQILLVDALAHELSGDIPAALASVAEVNDARMRLGGPLGAFFLEVAAGVAAAANRFESAAQFVGATDAYAAANALPMLPLARFWRSRHLERVRGQLGNAAYDAAYARGRELDEAGLLAVLDEVFVRETARSG